RVHGWIADMAPLYQQATVIWRPTRHDGMSFMALEALAHGRHVIWSYPTPGVIQCRDAASARTELERLLELHRTGRLERNHLGAEYVAKHFSSAVIRDGMLAGWQKIIESPLAACRVATA